MSVTVEGFQGYDTVFNRARNTAMCGKTMSVGGAAEMHYKVCQSLQEVSSTLQIDHSLSLSFFGLPGLACSDKLHFLNSLNLSSHSVAIVVYAKVVNGGHTITDASLAVDAPQNERDVEEFVMAYGDSYVTKVVTGAEYYASFTYYATTREEKMDLVMRMKAEGLFAWDIEEASIDQKINKFNSLRDVQVEFRQALRGMTGVALPEPYNLLDFVLKFPTLPIDKPQILHFESTGYEHAPGFNASLFCPIGRNRFLIAEDPHFLPLLSQVKGLENDVQAMEALLSMYGMYKGPNGEFLDEVKGAIKADRAEVQSMMQAYKAGRMKEVSPFKFTSLDYEKRIQSSYWTEQETMYLGGRGGSTRDYVTNVREFITSGRKIISIQLRSGRLVDRITITYNNGDLFEWGGTHTSQSNILYVPEGVYFSKIRIKDNGNAICYLQFVLTNGNSISGGKVGSSSTNDITYEPYSPPDYLYFCGFQLRSGIFIDGLRPIFAKFVI